jgi:hypothetical protein
MAHMDGCMRMHADSLYVLQVGRFRSYEATGPCYKMGRFVTSLLLAITFNEQGHRRAGEVTLGVRHQQEPIDGIVLNTASGPKT